MYAGFLDKLDIRDIGEQFHSPNFHFHPYCLQRFSSLQLSSEWAFVCCLYKARLSHHNQSLSTQILEDPAIKYPTSCPQSIPCLCAQGNELCRKAHLQTRAVFGMNIKRLLQQNYW